MNKEELNFYLNKLGLSSNEITVYLELVKSGANSISELSKKSKIPRTTTYENINKLINKGLVSYSVQKTKTVIVAENAGKVVSLFNAREKLLEEEMNDMSAIKEKLPSLFQSIISLAQDKAKDNLIKIRYYEGIDGIKEATRRSLDKGKDEILFISNIKTWRQPYNDHYDIDNYISTRIERKLFLKSLIIENKDGDLYKAEDHKHYRETRFFHDSYEFTPAIFIYEGEISIIRCTEPYSSIVIEDSDISNLCRIIFDSIWNFSKP